MDITIYLPDELGTRAKSERVNLSAMLRAALTKHFMEVDAMNDTLKGAQPVLLELEDKDGRPFHGKITGTLLAEWNNISIYLTDTGKVLAYDADKPSYQVIANPEAALRGVLDDDGYSDVMDALGIVPTIDLNV